jgi:glycerate kinase
VIKKIVVATDSFKGSLSAPEACRIIAAQAEKVFPQAEIIQLPISDGGEGLVEVAFNALGGERIVVQTCDPLGREIAAEYLKLADRSALIEMAGAGGLTLLNPREYDPLRTSTFGVGLMILDAIKSGANPIYIGLGGSATVDGGTGAATALGIHFFDEMGGKVTNGGGLGSIQSLDLRGLRELSYSGKIVFLTDVNNPLCGPSGAAEIFGPQKGATPGQVRQLDRGLRNFGGADRAGNRHGFEGYPRDGSGGRVCAAFRGVYGG